MEPATTLPDREIYLGAVRTRPPKLLIKRQPAHQIFLSNLFEFFRSPRGEAIRITPRAGIFWPDVFVVSKPRWETFLVSLLLHGAVIAMLWTGTRLSPQPTMLVEPEAQSPTHDIIFYQKSEYLPPLDTGGHNHLVATEKSEPAYAPQAILSVPPEADNHTQTIVAPPQLRLKQELALPNMVAWSPAQVAVPLAATSRLPEFRVPALPAPVVAPAPEVTTRPLRAMRVPGSEAVAPAPDLSAVASARSGEITIGHVDVVAPAPKLPMAEQTSAGGSSRAMRLGQATVVPPSPTMSGRETVSNSAQGIGQATVVPPSPAMSGGETVSNSAGRIVALGIHPTAPNVPVASPAGNRRGTFSANSDGKTGASGTPGGIAVDGKGAGVGPGIKGLPAGLLVGAKPAGGSTSGLDSNSAPVNSAKAVPAPDIPAASYPRGMGGEVTNSNASDLEKKVFGGRKIYSMTVNIPNLNSASGSWVIHFAELNPGTNSLENRTELAPPIATVTVDPGYPSELMRHNVAGTVALYAIIRRDGTIGEVQVLHGVDDRLDEFARAALARWRFNPASKDGQGVDVEAVVMVPFRPVRSKF
ncbi:MAG: TonB family protein [Acidobacteriales bacterium]|nr:TonB family protein [Terriglobales bacterium]